MTGEPNSPGEADPAGRPLERLGEPGRSAEPWITIGRKNWGGADHREPRVIECLGDLTGVVHGVRARLAPSIERFIRDRPSDTAFMLRRNGSR